MVWKVLKVCPVLLALAVALAAPITASAASVTPYEGNISSTYSQIFQDILVKKPLTDNYVFLRTSQYEYSLYVGKFIYEGSNFTSDGSVYVYTINTNSTWDA